MLKKYSMPCVTSYLKMTLFRDKIHYLKCTTFCVYLFLRAKKNRISRVLIFCEKRVFENFEFINFSPKEKRIRKRQLNQGTFGSVFVKINGKTGRSRWKKYCYWLVLKKAELTNIFCASFFSCICFRKIWILGIFGVYSILLMLFKRKFCVYSILQNRPKFAKFAKICTREKQGFTSSFLIRRCRRTHRHTDTHKHSFFFATSFSANFRGFLFLFAPSSYN